MLRGVSVVALLLLLSSVEILAAAVPTIDEAANRQELMKLTAEPLPEGAVAKHAPSFYGPDNLYEYMDGAADIFVLYGVRQLLHFDLRANATDISVDVFDMGSLDAAFGMYAAERSPDFRFIAVGAEGYQYEGMLNFVQDRYYVKLLGFGNGADALLDSFARLLSARIGANPAFPPLLSKFPVKSLKPHSEQYIPADPLGHAFLGPAYAAAYASGDQESKLFVTLARDEADARQRFVQLEQHFAKTGQCAPAPEIDNGAIRGNNSFEGSVIALRESRYLLLLVNPVNGNEELLKKAAENLK